MKREDSTTVDKDTVTHLEVNVVGCKCFDNNILHIFLGLEWGEKHCSQGFVCRILGFHNCAHLGGIEEHRFAGLEHGVAEGAWNGYRGDTDAL